jgi:hypothetical protein
VSSVDEAFAQLKTLAIPYAKHFDVHDDEHALVLAEPGARMSFVSVGKTARDVQFWFYPLAIFAELHPLLPAALAARVRVKNLIKFRTPPSAAERRALTKVMAAAWKRIAAIRALAGAPTHRWRLDLAQTEAAIRRFAKHGVERRANHVQVTLRAPRKAPAELAALEVKPGVFRFKTISPEQHAALAKLIR